MKIENNLTTAIQDISEMGAIKALEKIGMTTGEISKSQAYRVYGRQFIEDLMRDGRLKPCHVGSGKNGTIKFYVPDILAIRGTDRIQAMTIN